MYKRERGLKYTGVLYWTIQLLDCELCCTVANYKGEAWKWIIVFPFTGGSGDLPYLSTIPFHLQLLNLPLSKFMLYLYNITYLSGYFPWDLCDKSREYSWKRMGRANLCADRCCIYPPLFSGKSDWILCKSVSFLQRKSCCNATVFPSYVGAPAVFLSHVSFYSEIFCPLFLGNTLPARVFHNFSNSQIVTRTEVIERGV